MAIAPSKLGGVISSVVGARVDRPEAAALHAVLQERGLLLPSAQVADVEAAIHAVQAEFNYRDEFNSPNERLRERLRPLLSQKGQAWAEPLRSLDLPDEEDPPSEHEGKERRWRRLLGRRRS